MHKLNRILDIGIAIKYSIFHERKSNVFTIDGIFMFVQSKIDQWTYWEKVELICYVYSSLLRLMVLYFTCMGFKPCLWLITLSLYSCFTLLEIV